MRLDEAMNRLEEATNRLFASDPQVRSVGITQLTEGEDGYVFAVLREQGPKASMLDALDGMPLLIEDSPEGLEILVSFASEGTCADAALTAAAIQLEPEATAQRPLVCGLRVQNQDAKDRGRGLEGSIGVLVKKGGKTAILSANHVLADVNFGQRGDRILQPGVTSDDDPVAFLADFVTLKTSPAGAKPPHVNLNQVDAAIAELAANVSAEQRYLSIRHLPSPRTPGLPPTGDTVFKVGFSSGQTNGRFRGIRATVGPIDYPDLGECWFKDSIFMSGENFGQEGDSGAVAIDREGHILGIIYAKKGPHIFACPIDIALELLGCELVPPVG